MTRRDPGVTVVMPVYNAGRYVAGAIESILIQTYRDFEFLIFDDGSEDESFQLISDYEKRDPRIRAFRFNHAGYSGWLNRGIEMARGSLIARMDADDVSLPERFARQVGFLQSHPDVVAVGCDAICIDSDGDIIGSARHESDPRRLEQHLLSGRLGVIAHPTCMMRRDALLRVGGYRPEYEPTEDLDLWYRLLSQGQLANIPETLFKYRYHAGSVSYSNFERQQFLVRQIVNEGRLQHHLPALRGRKTSRPPSPASEHRRWARSSLALGHRSTARKHVRLAMRIDRFSMKNWLLLIASRLPASLLRLLKSLVSAVRRHSDRLRAHSLK
jgi:glycosyltransferase involved in cell wall biosynthesis